MKQLETNHQEKTLGRGFKYYLFSPRKLGKISNLTHIFRMGWFNHQLEDFEYREFSGSFIPMRTMP